MEFEITKRDYYRILSTPKDIVEEPQFCVLSAKKDKLYLQTGGASVYLKVNCPAKVKKKGSFSIDPFFLLDLHFTGEKINFTLKENQLYFKSGRFKGNVAINQLDKITTNPIKEIKSLTQVGLDDLEMGVNLLAIDSRIESDNILTKVAIIKNRLELTSTGAYCAARYRAKTKGELTFATQNYLLQSVLKSAQGEMIRVGANEKQIRIIADNMDCYFPVVQKDIADIKTFLKVAKKDKEQANFIINAAEAKAAMKSTSSVISAGGIEDVRVVVEIEKSKLKIHTVGSTSSSKNEFSIRKAAFKKGLSWKWSSSLLISFLDLLKDSDASVKVYKQFMLLKSLDRDLLYIIPQIR